MNHLLEAMPALAEVTVRANIVWPRFILSMMLIAAFFGYMIYAWMKR